MRISNLNLKPGQKQIVIIGGGFAGLAAAKALGGSADANVMLFDQKNHHLFQPLLYQVATAGLNPADIAVPIRAQFSANKNLEVHLGKVESVNLSEKFVSGGGIEFGYDYLIIACGAQHSYFGKNEWEDFAPGLKTLEQATEIRRRILLAFERAENELDPRKQKSLMTFVVVGGGPTGVELAGALADICRTVLVRDFKRINPAQAHILLIEAGPRVLAAFSESLSKKAKKDLETLGVDVRVNTRVERIDAAGVMTAAEEISTPNVFWAAGVQAADIGKRLLTSGAPVELDRAGRVKVDKDLRVPGFPEVFVCGDLASLELAPGKPVPGLAPAAMQMGRAAAENILRLMKSQATENFRYVDKGQMATIGKRKAVMQIKKFEMTGYFAWLGWLFVHIFYLIGFKNRVSVMAQWAWSYIFSKRGARLITNRDWHS
jgi:NADH dehydrogenase